jgi:hypothetical protein
MASEEALPTFDTVLADLCLQMYLFCLFMRVLLSWFPGIDWNAQPWTFLRLVRGGMLLAYLVAWWSYWQDFCKEQPAQVAQVAAADQAADNEQEHAPVPVYADHRALPSDLPWHPAPPVWPAGLHTSVWIPHSPGMRGRVFGLSSVLDSQKVAMGVAAQGHAHAHGQGKGVLYALPGVSSCSSAMHWRNRSVHVALPLLAAGGGAGCCGGDGSHLHHGPP